MMMENIKDIEWHEPRIAVPAFITMAVMPLTYSIAYGVVAGLAVYLALHLIITAADVVGAAVSGALPLPAAATNNRLHASPPPVLRSAPAGARLPGGARLPAAAINSK
jgi:hypothetical protein